MRLLAVTIAALALAAPASGAVSLPRTAQPITLECASIPGFNGLAYLEERRVVIDSRRCDVLNDPQASPEEVGPAVLTLAHEFIHVSLQTRDEGVADCWGLYLSRWWMVRLMGKTPAFAQRAYEAAWEEHETKASQYQGWCGFERVDVFTPLN